MLANFTVFQTFSFLLFTILELFLNQLKVLKIVFIFLAWKREKVFGYLTSRPEKI